MFSILLSSWPLLLALAFMLRLEVQQACQKEAQGTQNIAEEERRRLQAKTSAVIEFLMD